MSFEVSLILFSLAIAVACYLIGSVSFAIIFTWWFKRYDIRDKGSGNAGATNVLRSAGALPAALTFIFDMLKGIAAVAVGYIAFLNLHLLPGYDPVTLPIDPVYGMFIGGFFSFIGHIYPIYYKFRGGKGVICVAAMILILDWRVFAIIAGIFFLTILLSRMVSLGSILGALAFPILTYILYSSEFSYIWFGTTPLEIVSGSNPYYITLRTFETTAAACFFAIVLIKHIPNIKRIIRGEEKHITIKKKES